MNLKQIKRKLNKESFKNFNFKILKSWILDHRETLIRILIDVVLLIVIIITLNKTDFSSFFTSTEKEATYTEYTHNENEYITNLVDAYYTAYANNDTATLQMIASPISDAELSYVEFMSSKVEYFYVEDIYYKNGPKEGTYLVSVILDYKFYNINTVAPGLDFLYLDVDENGTTYINNAYGSFNSENQEFETDPEVSKLILEFEQEEDVLALEAEVQESFNEAMLSDNDLNVYVSQTLQNEMSEWASQYKVKILSDIGELSTVTDTDETTEESTGATSTESADTSAATTTDTAADTDTEEAATSGEERSATDSINLREKMDEDSDRLTIIYQGEKVTVIEDYATGWSKVKYGNYTGYVKTEYLE